MDITKFPCPYCSRGDVTELSDGSSSCDNCDFNIIPHIDYKQKLKEIEEVINREFEKQHGWREKTMGGIYWTEGRKNLGKEIKQILEDE